MSLKMKSIQIRKDNYSEIKANRIKLYAPPINKKVRTVIGD